MASVVIGLAASLVAAEIALAASVTISVTPTEAAPGGEVVVPVTVRGAEGMGPLQLDLVYDPALLEPADSPVEAGAAVRGAMIESNLIEPGRMRVAMISGEPIDGDGEVLLARYTVIGPRDGTCALAIEGARAWDHERNLEMLVSVEAGTFTISTPGVGLVPWLIGLAVVIGLGLLAAVVKHLRGRGHSGHGRMHPA